MKTTFLLFTMMLLMTSCTPEPISNDPEVSDPVEKVLYGDTYFVTWHSNQNDATAVVTITSHDNKGSHDRIYNNIGHDHHPVQMKPGDIITIEISCKAVNAEFYVAIDSNQETLYEQEGTGHSFYHAAVLTEDGKLL